MPGSNARALEKAKTLNADALVFDLEDAVAPDAKEMARGQVVGAATGGGYGDREIVIRVNGLDTPWGEPDVIAAAGAGANGILIPKVQTPGDLEAVRTVLRKAGTPSNQAIWAMMETPFAVLNAGMIAAAGPGEYPLTVLIMGTNDLAKETRASLDGARLGMITWLSICVAAGRAYKIDVIDGVFNGIGDEAGLRTELEQARLLGMDGKTLIHPSQIDPFNEAFTPPAAEVEWARKIVAAFDDPANAGKGVIQLDGKMVELLHAEMAKRTVALADIIAKRDSSV
jgi:citrate lyase subunit beta/citryl-CoA lyase